MPTNELKPYKKIPEDREKTFSINSICDRKDREVCSDDTKLFLILEV